MDGSNRMMESVMKIEVTCYAGYRGEETPRFICMANQRIEVQKVLDRWLAPDHRYFKILGDDHATYIIRHDSVTGEWVLTFYQDESVVGKYGLPGEVKHARR
jgi:hypothetical protein